jgi:hypothetical protein
LVGFGLLAVFSAIAVLSRNGGGPMPTLAQTTGYQLQYRDSPAGPYRILQVDSNGDACTALSQSGSLVHSCVLTTNLDTSVIAGEAFGDLNVKDTAAYEAIIWRSVLDGAPDDCDHGGLLDTRLATCRAAAQSGQWGVTDAGIGVLIEKAPPA